MNYTDFVKTVESHSWHEPPQRLLHAAMGLVTEIGELYETTCELHLAEELGDICWYLALGLDALGVNWDDVEIIPEDDFFKAVRGETSDQTLVILSSELLDMLKKFIFYGREIQLEKAASHLVMMKNALHWALIYSNPDLTLEMITEANMKKLKARYPDKFTEQAANVRDVNAEYDAMKH